MEIILDIVIVTEHEKVWPNNKFYKILNRITCNVRFLNSFTKCKCVLKNYS